MVSAPPPPLTTFFAVGKAYEEVGGTINITVSCGTIFCAI